MEQAPQKSSPQKQFPEFPPSANPPEREERVSGRKELLEHFRSSGTGVLPKSTTGNVAVNAALCSCFLLLLMFFDTRRPLIFLIFLLHFYLIFTKTLVSFLFCPNFKHLFMKKNKDTVKFYVVYLR